jgi:hypothetical protein
MSLLLALWSKAKFYILAAAAFFAAIAAAWWRAREDGKNAIRLEQAKAREKLQEKYDEIDRAPADVDAAYERLGRMRDDQSRR